MGKFSVDLTAIQTVLDLIAKLSPRARRWLVWRIVAEAERDGLPIRRPV